MLKIRRDDKDRPNRVPWPPLLFASTLLAAGLLERLVDLPIGWHADWMRALGVLLATAGPTLAYLGIARFRTVGTPVDPTARAAKLATDGIYAWTRNPMYLGMLLLAAGLGLILRSGFLVLLTPVLGVALQKLAIEREEAFLERRFGEAYRDYKAGVRRWI